MSRIRVLIVDDEEPARAKLRRFLGAEGDVEVVGEARDGMEAVALVADPGADVVFLDVQMPRLDGFGVVRRVGVGRMPLTVFVTAFDQHALAAFEVEALDYLLKPFGAERFRRLMARVRSELRTRRSADLAARLESLLGSVAAVSTASPSHVDSDAAAGPPLRRLMVEKGPGRQVLLDLRQVEVVRADGNYLVFRTAEGERRRRGTLKELEARLDPEEFLRINRSEIVRLEAVAELQPWFHGDYRVCLHDGSVLTWSRRYRARFKDGL
ncbi:MAG: LytTR family DNA-binding domain-containing protein [Holophagales bacterium]|nr:LytTR family DNA-binding domain-containing protein [Holophagales bacterium]